MEEVNYQINCYRASALELELVAVHQDVHNILGILSSYGQVINIDSNIFILVITVA